jgi:hypothetical protein
MSTAKVRITEAIWSIWRGVGAFAVAMERTTYDDLSDRMSHLAHEVAQLNQKIQRSEVAPGRES